MKIKTSESIWLLVCVLAGYIDLAFLPADQLIGLVSLSSGVLVLALLQNGWRFLPWMACAIALPCLGFPLSIAQLALLVSIKLCSTSLVFAVFGPDAQQHVFKIRDSVRLLFWGAGIAGFVSSTSTMLLLPGMMAQMPPQTGMHPWLMLYLSHFLGVLIIVPGFWALIHERAVLRANWLIETTFLLAIAASGGMLQLAHYNASTLQWTYLCFPLMVWSALRMGQVTNSLMALLLLLILGSPTVNQTLPNSEILMQGILLAMVQQMGIFLAVIRRENELSVSEARLAKQVFHHASEGIMMISSDHRVVAVNPAFSRITGYSETDALGHQSRIFDTRPGNPNQYQSILLSELDAKGHWEGEMLDKRKNGEVYPAWLSISAVHDHEGRLSRYVGIFSDYTTRKQAEQRVNYLAKHDSLTELFNRNGFHEELAKALIRASTKRRGLAVFFIDLDRFKSINDTLGHDVGDQLLRVVAQRLKKQLKQDDIIARLGGDEFTVVLENVHLAAQIAQVAERLLHTIAESYLINGQELFVTGSIGISLYPNDAGLASQLMRNADLAMYRAKELGKNAYQFFAQDMNSSNSQHFSVQAALRFALEREQLYLMFQPQMNLATGQLCGMECLIRWRHPEMGEISPVEFIPIAEETGLILPIGHWVLQRACHIVQQWRAQGLNVPKIAVNLSVRQFKPGVLVEQVASVLAESGLPPYLLELEVTESLIMRRINEAVEIMNALKAMGLSLAIDDFGTGYSSLSQLKYLPLDILKIDRSFVEGLPSSNDDTAIAQSIIAMAQKLGLSVVAEGVETIAQMQTLRDAGCDMMQGYYYAKPLNEEEMGRFIARVSA